MNKLSFFLSAAMLVTAGAAVAQGPGPRPDRNADVTRAQVIDRTDQAFARLDANNDGRFTPDEARARGEQRRAQHMTRMFDRLDANHDGSITREEMAQAHANRGGPGGPGGPGAEGRRGGPGGPGMRHRGMRHGGPGGPGMRGMRGMRMFGEQGFVTREQFRERALARFDRADANHDGTVTAAERQAMRDQWRQGRRDRPGQDD
ncbi:MAG TPA: EF-hand domain-containing protein [Allosphingosinicella sp.]|nr:EF-hand domain-containing protein [Allosphingosinicella sp.]